MSGFRASLGIAANGKLSGDARETFERNTLDPDGILAAITIGLYPDITSDERVKILVDHAECRNLHMMHKQYKTAYWTC